jgi:hypothetical protein
MPLSNTPSDSPEELPEAFVEELIILRRMPDAERVRYVAAMPDFEHPRWREPLKGLMDICNNLVAGDTSGIAKIGAEFITIGTAPYTEFAEAWSKYDLFDRATNNPSDRMVVAFLDALIGYLRIDLRFLKYRDNNGKDWAHPVLNELGGMLNNIEEGIENHGVRRVHIPVNRARTRASYMKGLRQDLLNKGNTFDMTKLPQFLQDIWEEHLLENKTSTSLKVRCFLSEVEKFFNNQYYFFDEIARQAGYEEEEEEGPPNEQEALIQGLPTEVDEEFLERASAVLPKIAVTLASRYRIGLTLYGEVQAGNKTMAASDIRLDLRVVRQFREVWNELGLSDLLLEDVSDDVFRQFMTALIKRAGQEYFAYKAVSKGTPAAEGIQELEKIGGQSKSASHETLGAMKGIMAGKGIKVKEI